MRILIVLAVCLVFFAALLFDTAALIQLMLIAVTGDYGAHPMWLVAEACVIAGLTGLAVFRRPAAPAPVRKPRAKKPGVARTTKAASRKKAAK
jgi:hypothetical protein